MRLCKTVVIKCTMVARTAFSVVFVSLQATAQQWCSGFCSTQTELFNISEQTKGGCSGLRLKRRNYNTVSDKVFFFFFVTFFIAYLQHHTTSQSVSNLLQIERGACIYTHGVTVVTVHS